MRHPGKANLFALAVVAVFAASSFAEEPTASKKPQQGGQAKISSFPAAAATIESILDTAVRNIARRYNLNESQTRYTDEMMKTEVNRFLLEYENEVWPVLRDLLSTQVLGKPPESTEEMKRLGKSARPLAKLAQEAILRANEQWRDILSEEQKRIHDFDLAQMDKQFQRIDANLQSWEEGRRTQDPIFSQSPRVVQGSPPRPPRPPEKELKESPVVEPLRITTLFDTFVEEFIKDYRLDESQIDTARSILKEFKAKASDFKNSKKLEFAELANQQKKAIEARDRAKLKLVEAERKKLLTPVYGLFGQMEERLRGLLTSPQRELYAARQKGKAGPARAGRKKNSATKNVASESKANASGKTKAADKSGTAKPTVKAETDDS